MKCSLIKILFIIFIFQFLGNNIIWSNNNLIPLDKSLTVEQKYGDRIELMGIKFKDPLVLCQVFIAIFFIIIFIQSGLDKIISRQENIIFFKDHFSNSPFKNHTSFLLTILTFTELVCGFTLIYGIYYSFIERTTLWIFYGFVFCVINLFFLLIGQRVAKDYNGASDLGIYFMIVILGIMSMY